MNNDLMLVSRETLEQWANDLALHGVGDIETAKNIDDMLAAPAAQAVEPTDEMLDAWDQLNKIAYRVQVTQAAGLSEVMRELEEARKRLDAHIKDAAYEIRRVADALHARAALAAPVQFAPCQKCDGTGSADSGGVQPWGEAILIPYDCTAPVQSEQEPVAWMDQDGALHTALDSAEFSRRPVTPLYAAPVRAVRMPEQHGDRCDSSEAEAYQNGWNACLDAVARLNGEQPTADPAASLAKVADGTVQHVFNGMCPDAVEGHDSRDPDCPACQALILFSGQQ